MVESVHASLVLDLVVHTLTLKIVLRVLVHLDVLVLLHLHLLLVSIRMHP